MGYTYLPSLNLYVYSRAIGTESRVFHPGKGLLTVYVRSLSPALRSCELGLQSRGRKQHASLADRSPAPSRQGQGTIWHRLLFAIGVLLFPAIPCSHFPSFSFLFPLSFFFFLNVFFFSLQGSPELFLSPHNYALALTSGPAVLALTWVDLDGMALDLLPVLNV